MRGECESVSLGSLGVLRVRGADTRSFLQGQVSSDVAQLAAQRSLLAGYHNPQGRVIALLRLLQLAPDDVLAILPRELVTPVAQRLAKFILRAKTKVADESAQWTISGLVECDPASGAAGQAAPTLAADEGSVAALAAALPAAVNGVTQIDAALAVRVAQSPARWLLVSPLGEPPALSGCRPAGMEVWQRLAIAAGEPQVYAATSEAFVAQMLNLDALGAIAFDKGCYTGQEIIARAHYRGKIKRRLQRFLTAAAARLNPGDDGELEDGHPFKVVDAAQRSDGRCEFLAVTAVETASAQSGARAASPAGEAPLKAQMLGLPYSLPD
jgi:folate-binding protein YgfZ